MRRACWERRSVSWRVASVVSVLAGGRGAGVQDQLGVVEVADDLVPDELVELVGAGGGL